MKASIEPMSHAVLLYYWFTQVENPEEFAAEHRLLCERLNLRGRILIAGEGINGTVSGLVSDCESYMSALKATPGFEAMEFKLDEAEGHAFKAMHVRVRSEIITLGRELEKPVHEFTGPYLEPVEWREMMGREDVVILDGRNGYESEVGHFEGAICPPLQNFREFPDWLEANRALFEGKRVLSYCTGGIRCEKLSAWMLAAGFGEVFQLHGGVVRYGKDPETQGEGWLGTNVVFDERVNVPVGPKAKPLTLCRSCGEVTSNFVNCANVECNLRMVMCAECEETTQRCCSDTCRTAPRQRLKGKKWYESTLKVTN